MCKLNASKYFTSISNTHAHTLLENAENDSNGLFASPCRVSLRRYFVVVHTCFPTTTLSVVVIFKWRQNPATDALECHGISLSKSHVIKKKICVIIYNVKST